MFSFLKFWNNAHSVEQAALKTIETEAAKVAALASSAFKAVEAAPGEARQWSEAEIAAMRANAAADAVAISKIAKPARPGDTPPRAFVGNTLDQLNKALTSYTTERDLLAKDIAKLTDEHTQLNSALDVLQAAINKLIPEPPTQAAPQTWTQDDVDIAAAKAIVTELQHVSV